MERQRRSVRLNELRNLFKSRKAGCTVRELARMFGCTMRTIERDLLVLQNEMHEPLRQEHGRYFFAEEQRLEPLELSLQQARALYIATRLYLRYSDEGDPYATGALRQIALRMPERIRKQAVAAAELVSNRPYDPEFARNMAQITDAWARQRVLKLSYRSAGKARPREVQLEPYFIEPSAAGLGTYVIGYSRTHHSMRTFKIERVVSAEMLPVAFEIPPEVDLDELLSSAWGIIWGEGKTVRLRFSKDVAWRVRETRWHPTQSLEELPDGDLILTMTVASMMEVGRWVRSWGDTCEVLAPPELREELREEAVRLARQYARPAKQPARKRASRRKPAAPEEQTRLPA